VVALPGVSYETSGFYLSYFIGTTHAGTAAQLARDLAASNILDILINKDSKRYG